MVRLRLIAEEIRMLDVLIQACKKSLDDSDFWLLATLENGRLRKPAGDALFGT